MESSCLYFFRFRRLVEALFYLAFCRNWLSKGKSNDRVSDLGILEASLTKTV